MPQVTLVPIQALASKFGAATTAPALGVPDRVIKTLDWWSSAAHQVYIHTPDGSIISVSSQLVGKQVSLCPLGLSGVGSLRLGPSGAVTA